MEQRYSKQKGVTTRECSKCRCDLGDRYGKQRYCKKCHAENMRNNRPKYSELDPLAKMKANARSYAHVYRDRGLIKKENCRNCGSHDSQMHHEDYSKPTQVIWLCRKCHLAEHAISLACDDHPKSIENVPEIRPAPSI